MKIADNVYYVGVSNPTLRVFDIIMCTEYGTTYNSYLVKGADKTALIDGAHKGFEANFQENVEAITDFANIDYMVVNHTEPDHSGAIRLVIEKNPDIVVYGTAACLKNLDNIVRLPFNRVAVKDGDTLELGGKTLTFCVSPNIHWPDTMMTYLAEDKILFSCDFLARISLSLRCMSTRRTRRNSTKKNSRSTTTPSWGHLRSLSSARWIASRIWTLRSSAQATVQ